MNKLRKALAGLLLKIAAFIYPDIFASFQNRASRIENLADRFYEREFATPSEGLTDAYRVAFTIGRIARQVRWDAKHHRLNSDQDGAK